MREKGEGTAATQWDADWSQGGGAAGVAQGGEECTVTTKLRKAL